MATAPRHPVPVPAVLPEPLRGARGRRTAEIGVLVARHVAPVAARRLVGQRVSPAESARPLRLVFESLGATFVKLGQLVASSPGVFGDEVANEFRSCLDQGPAVPFPAVRAVVERTIGRTLEDAFAAFDPQPIGRASIAVVHAATLRDGRRVAVKVLRPAIAATVATDLACMEPLLVLLARLGVPETGQLLRLLTGFREQIAEELDLRNEAGFMTYYRGLLEHVELPRVVVPSPHPALSGAQVLTMDFLEGVPFDDVGRIAALGGDPGPLLEEMVRGWFMTAIRDGTFHGDVHAGNLLFLRDGRVGVIDWGIVGRLDPDTHAFLRAVVQANLGDETAWDTVVGYVLRAYGTVLHQGLGMDEAQIRALVRGMVEPMLTRPFGEVSLGAFLAGLQGRVATAEDAVVGRRSWRATLRRLRDQRRIHHVARAEGTISSSFDRGSFLLAKQLLYFERYGKMFLADTALLSDRAFFTKLLGEGPIHPV